MSVGKVYAFNIKHHEKSRKNTWALQKVATTENYEIKSRAKEPKSLNYLKHGLPDHRRVNLSHFLSPIGPMQYIFFIYFFIIILKLLL